MATLRETLRKNRAQAGTGLVSGPGGLTETSQEEVQKLAGQAGLPAAPTTAIGTAIIGGSPDQQKMAGSPAQVQAALRASQSPSQYLSTQQRQQQARTEMTGQEQQQREKSEELKALGGLGDRVDNFIEGQRQKLAAAEVKPTEVEVAPQEGAAVPTDPAQLKSLKDAAKALLANPNDMNSLLLINQALGKPTNATITPAELQQLYEQSSQTLARSGAATIEDDLQVEDLIAGGDFPYTLDQLSGLLGVPPEQLNTYSVAQLRNQLDQVAQQEFQQTQQLEQQAGSALLGAAERQQARQLAREASATGTRSTEQDVVNLERQIENADQVTFGGQVYQIDELLKDDTISGIITDYLKMDEASRQEFAKKEPALVEFITKNEALLQDAADAMGKGATEFQTIQNENAALANVQGEQLDPSLMKAIIPGFGELSAARFDTSKVPVFQQLQSLNPDQQKQMAQNLNELAVDPDLKQFIPELASLNSNEVKELGLDKPNPQTLSTLRDNVKTVNALNNMDPTSDVDSIITAFTGMSDPQKAQQEVTDNFSASVLGLGGSDISMFDSDGDGKIDNAETLLNTMKKATSKPSLLDAAKGTLKTYQPKEVPTYDPVDTLEKTVFNKLSSAASDGKITAEEIRGAGFNDYDLFDIQDAGLNNKWGEAGKTVNDMINRSRDIETNLALKNFSIPYVPDLTQASALAPKETLTTTFGATFKVPSPAAIAKLRETAEPIKQSIETLNQQIKLWEQGAKGTEYDPRRVDINRLKKRVADLSNQINVINTRANELQTKRDEEIAFIKGYDNLSGTSDGGKTAKQLAGKKLSDIVKASGSKTESLLNAPMHKVDQATGVPVAKKAEEKVASATKTIAKVSPKRWS